MKFWKKVELWAGGSLFLNLEKHIQLGGHRTPNWIFLFVCFSCTLCTLRKLHDHWSGFKTHSKHKAWNLDVGASSPGEIIKRWFQINWARNTFERVASAATVDILKYTVQCSCASWFNGTFLEEYFEDKVNARSPKQKCAMCTVQYNRCTFKLHCSNCFTSISPAIQRETHGHRPRKQILKIYIWS